MIWTSGRRAPGTIHRTCILAPLPPGRACATVTFRRVEPGSNSCATVNEAVRPCGHGGSQRVPTSDCRRNLGLTSGSDVAASATRPPGDADAHWDLGDHGAGKRGPHWRRAANSSFVAGCVDSTARRDALRVNDFFSWHHRPGAERPWATVTYSASRTHHTRAGRRRAAPWDTCRPDLACAARRWLRRRMTRVLLRGRAIPRRTRSITR